MNNNNVVHNNCFFGVFAVDAFKWGQLYKLRENGDFGRETQYIVYYI